MLPKPTYVDILRDSRAANNSPTATGRVDYHETGDFPLMDKRDPCYVDYEKNLIGIHGDGNCMFRAIAFAVSNPDLGHAELRRKVCDAEAIDSDLKEALDDLTRHRLGCFCTHHSLGGGGRIRPPPPLLSRKRMDVERRARRHSKDLDETLPNHFRKFKIEVTCQVKVRSKVKIGCFQVADRSDLKRSMFRPKLSICTPKDQAKVPTSEIVSYLAQVKVKVRSEKVTKSKIFKCVV